MFIILFRIESSRINFRTKLLSDRLYAFQKRHICETQLITVINDWSKILDDGGQVDTFILDFEKAFDTPPHELRKCKLYGYGIDGKILKWVDSFLCLRQQRVVVNGIKLGSRFVKSPSEHRSRTIVVLTVY